MEARAVNLARLVCYSRGPFVRPEVRVDLNRYLEENQDRFVAELSEALRIPSVSAQPEHKPDVKRCAEHFASRLRQLGMTRVEVVPTAGHPIVYAEWMGAPGKPTALLYGHYDVQPPEPLELWKT